MGMQTPRGSACAPLRQRCNIRHAPRISWLRRRVVASWPRRSRARPATRGGRMLTLSVIGVEDGAIIAAGPGGERFRLPVDQELRTRLLQVPSAPTERRLTPREIQTHVRAGLSPQQVSALTGAPVAYIERFVGPVIAEREYVTESARAVRLPPETEGARPKTFGVVMAERLAALAATGVRWTSTKESAGWIVALTFSADGIEHDARWRFDPKRMQLEPENVEAATLSQQGV